MANPLFSGRLLFCPVILILILMTGPLLCQNAISNEQLLSEAAGRATLILFDSLEISTGVFHISAPHGIDEILIDGIIGAVQKNGCMIEGESLLPPESTFNVSVRLSALQFSYQKGKSRGFWKKPFIKRKLSGQIAVSLKGKIDYIGYRDISYEDQILTSQATIVASPRYNQLAPETPRLGASRFVEPIAVTATVGGLMYLFFASR
jgi:hypothetical protein